MKQKKEKVYLSGKMSGLTREEVLRRFAKAEDTVRMNGCLTKNPTRVWVFRWTWLYRMIEFVFGRERAYDLVLLYDIWLLSRCDSIYMVGGDWRDNSRGAMTEYYFAGEKDMVIDISEESEDIMQGIEAANEWLDRELEKLFDKNNNEQTNNDYE